MLTILTIREEIEEPEMKVTITKVNDLGNIKEVEYVLTNKYYNNVPGKMGFRPGTSQKYIIVEIKKYNMWRCFQPKTRIQDILHFIDEKYWNKNNPIKLCGV